MTPAYDVPAVTTADEGNYQLEVSNVNGAATSAVAVVVVRVPATVFRSTRRPNRGHGDAGDVRCTGLGFCAFGFSVVPGRRRVGGAGFVDVFHPCCRGLADVGNYHFVVSNAAGAATSTVARLELVRPPALTGILTDRWIEWGVRSTIPAGVEGSEPIEVRWFRFGTELPGQPGRELVLESPTSADSGSYYFTASNGAGTVTSVPAWFEVVRRPELVAPLADRKVARGAELVLSASVQGDGPLTFLWYRDGVLMPGHSGSVLRIASVSAADSGLYRFEALNPVGQTSSPNARIEVWEPPTAVVMPDRVRRARGGVAELRAQLGGDGPFELQWIGWSPHPWRHPRHPRAGRAPPTAMPGNTGCM